MPSIFVGRATGGVRQQLDLQELRRALSILPDPSHGCELFSLPSARSRVRAGADLDALAAAALELADDQRIYFRINPVTLGRGDRPARKADIVRRIWLLLDVDPVKDEAHKDDPANEAEYTAVADVAAAAQEWLTERGWPSPLLVDSGNGRYLLYRIDLPNDDHAHQLLRAFLKALSARFNSPSGTIDTSVHDAPRLAKLPGTVAKKGTATPDRPHRPCRILWAPQEWAVVSAEMIVEATAALTATGDPPEPPSPPSPPADPYSTFKGRATGGENAPSTAYGRVALEREIARVVGAAKGGRNKALNRAAFSLGQLVGGGVLTRAQVEEGLWEAGCRCGLDADPGCGPAGIRATVKSGLEAGLALPRTAPERAPTVKHPPTPPPPEGEPLTICMANVTPLKVEWLMPNRIPKRFITVMAGRTGIGKSFVALDLIARITKGDEIPFAGGLRFERGGALIISEDPHDYVLAPRLLESGADMTRIRAMTWKAMGAYRLGDRAMLERACAEVEGPKIVMIDPPTNFLGDVDEHRNSEVRQTVMGVVEWVAGQDLACLFILHVNKNQGKGVDALNRVMGSVAWVTTSRIAHGFTTDPDDKTRCLFVPLKNNVGPIGKGIAYQIVKTDGLARVEWLEEVDTTADDAMAGEQTRKKKRNVVAAEWLEEVFKDVDELPSNEVWGRKRSETSLSDDALKEAKDLLGIRATRKTGSEGEIHWFWVWSEEAKGRWQLRKARVQADEADAGNGANLPSDSPDAADELEL